VKPGSIASTAIVLAAASAALFACADDGAPAATPDADGGIVIPAVDGSADAADVDARAPADAAPDADAGPRICSDDGFCHTVVPEGQSLRGVWGDGEGIVWAVSNEGSILRWDGASWSIHTTFETALSAIWGSGPTDVWVAGAAGLFHGAGPSSDALVFTPVADLPGDATIPIRAIWGTGPNDVWAVGGAESFDLFPPRQRGRVLHRGAPEGSTTGFRLDEDLSSREISFRFVWGSPTSGTWLQGQQRRASGSPDSRVLRREPGADAWTVMDLPEDTDAQARGYASEMIAANLSSDTSVWLRGRTGFPTEALWHGASADGGKTFTWSVHTPNDWSRSMLAFWGSSANDTWAVGRLGLVTHWDGSAWTQARIRVTSAPVASTFWAIWAKNDDDLWVVGDEIALHKTNTGKP